MTEGALSKQAEEAYEKWRAAHDEECRRDLVIGAKVYRAEYGRIEEGEVIAIDRIRYTDGIFDNGREVDDPNGPYTRYTACFGPGQWERQTYQWRFFYNINDARKKLAKDLRERAKDARRDADRWDAMAATFEAQALEIGRKR